MNFLNTKKRLNIILQGLSFVATLFYANSTFTMKNTSLSNTDRVILNDMIIDDTVSIKYPSIKILDEQPANKRYGTCHNYAISTSLGLKGKIPKTLPIIGTDDWHYALNFTEKYCKETSTPQKGDLAVYYKKHWLLPEWLSPKELTHTGIVRGDNIVESKWGIQKQVLQHPTFDVPQIYGDEVKYFRITTPTDEIIKNLHEIVHYHSNYDELCGMRNRKLVKYAEQGNNDQVWEHLQFNMCTDVEATNSEGQSLFMIGAKNNNYPLMKLGIDYGANVKRKDIFNKSAHDLALEKNNKSLARTLHLLQKETPQRKQPLYNTLQHIANPTEEAQIHFWNTINS